MYVKVSLRSSHYIFVGNGLSLSLL